MSARSRPACTIIGGTNGSGKSTIYDRLRLPGRFVNADVIARAINPDRPETAALSAGRRTLVELARLLGVRESFVYETTLSSHQAIALMRTARQGGYDVGLVFVALNSADLNVQRVADRVTRGGHGIPEATIRRRYEAALARLPEAIRLAAGTMLFDNSTAAGPQPLLQIRSALVGANALDDANPFHNRLARAVGEALSMPADTIFRTAKPG